MDKNNTHKSFIPLWILASICFLIVIFALLTSVSFSDYLSEDNFKVEGFFVPLYHSTNNEFNIISLNNDAFNKQEKLDLTKNFLIEYITNRYTVSGNQYEMEKNIGYNSPETLQNGLTLKLPSYKGINQDGKIEWTNAYKDFLKYDYPEIERLMANKTTRAVRIISAPQKSDDWWTMIVEFIYRYPNTYSFSVAQKEKYEIRLNISPQGIRSTEDISLTLPAGNVFKTYIIDIQKTKL